MPKWKPLKGNKYGKLTVLEDYRDETKPKGRQHWCICQCSCGDMTIIAVKATDLARGHKISCGCRHRPTHGLLHTRFYGIYYHVVQRCNNPNNDRYARYGGRGIKCLWNSFQEFYDDMYEEYQKHYNEHDGDTTIDRINNNGNYCKENCRWLTNKEQQANKECTVGIEDTDGELLSLFSYCQKYNLPYQRIRYNAKKNHISVLDELYSGRWNINGKT